jgi:fructokinase
MREATGTRISTEEIAALPPPATLRAQASLDRHASRLARGVAHVVNILDPHVIVLGGGLSKLATSTPCCRCWPRPTCSPSTPKWSVEPPRWGDAGGVRGAAWLWG